MPIYDYKCQDCEHEFHKLQSVHSEVTLECPKCKGVAKRVISLNSVKTNYRDAKEIYEKEIKPEAKKIADKIRSGDENAAADLFGTE